MKPLFSLLALTTALCVLAPVAHAEQSSADRQSIRSVAFTTNPLAKERFMLRLRSLYVAPDDSSRVNIGGKLQASNALTPELDASYFFTPNIAAELIAATTKHTVKYNDTTELGRAWILPPTVTLQYHFTPDRQFSPYIGAGLNYSVFYGEKSAPGFTDVSIGNGVGYALQTGFDYWIDDHWGFNMDVKKLFLNVDATANNGLIQANIDLDPWLVGAGVSYRF